MTDPLTRMRQRRLRRRMEKGAARARPSTAPLRLIGAGVALWAGASFLLIGVAPVFHGQLIAGQRAPASIVALTDFQCLDLARTEAARRLAGESTLPVFVVNLAPMSAGARALERLVTHVADARRRDPSGETSGTELSRILDLVGFDMAPQEALALVPAAEQAAAVTDAITNALRRVWLAGIVTAEERAGAIVDLSRDGQIILDPGPAGAPRIVDAKALLTPEQAAEEFARAAAAALSPLATAPDTLRRLAHPWLQPNLAYSPALTEQRRRESVDRVESLLMTVRSGTTLIGAGETATPQVVEMLAAHERRLREQMSPADEWLQRLGRSALLAIAAFCGLAMLPITDPSASRSRRHLVLYVTLGLGTVGAARLIVLLVHNGLVPRPYADDFLLPGLGALLAVLLAGRCFSVPVGAWCALSVPVFAVAPFPSLFRSVAVVTVAALAGRNARKRSLIFRAGAWMGVAGAFLVLCETLLMRNPVVVALPQAASALAAGVVTSALSLLLLPLFESAFGLTSDIHLLELSDPSHPLLQRLAVEAPGTYHHSLMVANLAHAAADEIGAQGLLARVGALYHDIGKLATPRYFIENVPPEANPHNDLSPQMSTLVILAHVKEGLALARRHRLPAPIRDAISQHHGASLVSYFYARALDAHTASAHLGPAGPARPDEHAFRYSGPRPQSREVALIALADAVEAAARSLANPSPGRIERLAHDVVRQRLLDGELDECGLTLSDLNRVARAFVFVLNSMYHGRVPYEPSEDPNRQPPAAPPADGSAARPDSLADDTRRATERAQTLG